MDETIEISSEVAKMLRGDVAWFGLALSILVYDIAAMKTRKVETLSSALWRSLDEPKKALAALTVWGVLTHHLFVNKKARSSYSIHLTKNKKES